MAPTGHVQGRLRHILARSAVVLMANPSLGARWRTSEGEMRILSGVGVVALTVVALAGCTIGDNGAPGAERITSSEPAAGSDSSSPAELALPSDLVPGRAVGWSVGNLEPQQTYLLVQCVEDSVGRQVALSEACDLTRPSQVRVRTDDQGRASGKYTPRAAIGVGERTDVNCLTTDCVLALTNSADRVSLAHTLSWRPGVQMPRGPQLRLGHLKRRGTTIWGTAAVQGTGYRAGSRVEVFQCPARTPGASADTADCLYDTTGSFKADSTGRFEGRMQIAFKFQRSNGQLIDCQQTPRTCALAVPFPHGYGVRMSRVLFSSAIVPES